MMTSPLPSVTQILQPWSDFSRIPDHVLENAAERGTKVHAFCCAMANGCAWIPPVPEDCQGFVESFRLWLPRIKRVIATEFELSCPHAGYCGHPDILAILEGDEHPTLIDLKTPAAQSKTWRLQLAAYRDLLYGTDDFPSAKRHLALRLNKEGKRPIVDEYTDHYTHDLAVFKNAFSAWRFFNQ